MLRDCICGELLVLTGFGNLKCPKCGIIETMDVSEDLKDLSLKYPNELGFIHHKIYKVGDVICFELMDDDGSELSYLVTLEEVLNTYNISSEICRNYLIDFKENYSKDKL